jgi:hypothetical protein
MRGSGRHRELRTFLNSRRNERVMLGTTGGFIIAGILVGFTRRVITLRDAQVLAAGGEPADMRVVVEKVCSVTMWGIPEDNPFRQVVLTGQIVDIATGTPADGALVKVLLQRGEQAPETMGYTYSGRDGWYMFPFRRARLSPQDRVSIQVVGCDPASP